MRVGHAGCGAPGCSRHPRHATLSSRRQVERGIFGAILILSLTSAGAGLATGSTLASLSIADSNSAVAELREQARDLEPLASSKLARAFLKATAVLPRVEPRTVSYDSARTHYYWESEAAALPESARAKLITRTLDESFYYTTRYGTPLAYVRALDLLAAAGFDDVAGKRIADYGYGTVGHLRLLASLGADVTGIEVDPLLNKLYSMPGDQGPMRSSGKRAGRVTLVHGSFPGDRAVADKVGGDLDLFISKNTLKNGYLHPEKPVNPRMLVHLDVDDSIYVRELSRRVKPGGYVMIYNLCPAPAPPDKPYIPWADGRCPFPRAMWESMGFRVIEYDRDDTPFARTMGKALGWDQGDSPMDLEHDLFATYTLVVKLKK